MAIPPPEVDGWQLPPNVLVLRIFGEQKTVDQWEKLTAGKVDRRQDLLYTNDVSLTPCRFPGVFGTLYFVV